MTMCETAFLSAFRIAVPQYLHFSATSALKSLFGWGQFGAAQPTMIVACGTIAPVIGLLDLGVIPEKVTDAPVEDQAGFSPPARGTKRDRRRSELPLARLVLGDPASHMTRGYSLGTTRLNLPPSAVYTSRWKAVS